MGFSEREDHQQKNAPLLLKTLNLQSDKTIFSPKWMLHAQSPKKKRNTTFSRQSEWHVPTKNSPVDEPSEQEKQKKLQSKLHQKRNNSVYFLQNIIVLLLSFELFVDEAIETEDDI